MSSENEQKKSIFYYHINYLHNIYIDMLNINTYLANLFESTTAEWLLRAHVIVYWAMRESICIRSKPIQKWSAVSQFFITYSAEKQIRILANIRRI